MKFGFNGKYNTLSCGRPFRFQTFVTFKLAVNFVRLFTLETTGGSMIFLEAASKAQIRFKGKAQADEKAQHTK